jgi:tetratricopeptide (TPR) repeat protein
MVHHRLGRHDEALACYRSALALFRGQHDRKHEAVILVHIGDAQHAAGHPRAARDAWRLALDIFVEIDHPDAGEVRAKLSAGEEVRAKAG